MCRIWQIIGQPVQDWPNGTEMEEFIFYRFFRNTSLALTAAIVSAKQFGVELNTLLKFVIYNAMQETRVRIQMSDKK